MKSNHRAKVNKANYICYCSKGPHLKAGFYRERIRDNFLTVSPWRHSWCWTSAEFLIKNAQPSKSCADWNSTTACSASHWDRGVRGWRKDWGEVEEEKSRRKIKHKRRQGTQRVIQIKQTEGVKEKSWRGGRKQKRSKWIVRKRIKLELINY